MHLAPHLLWNNWDVSETGVLNPEDVADPEADKEEEEKVGTRLSMPDPPDPPKATKDLDDLKVRQGFHFLTVFKENTACHVGNI